jgi:tetratricopeptide (TPR) repeat protein
MRRVPILYFCLTVVLLPIAGCGKHGESASKAAAKPDTCAMALAPLAGSDSAEKIDEQIAALQRAARMTSNPSIALEQLGQRFVAKARLTHDSGYYTLADQCAQCLESKDPGNLQAVLLRGHVLHQLHRFKEAEALARQVVAKRGSFLDYGLLGDALMEQGKLYQAELAYQKMMDLRPFYQSYARAAHVRWLRGDLRGAIELMAMAVTAASPQDPESVAWAYSRLALYQLQNGATKEALNSCQAALGFLHGYAPALLVRGRALLGQGKTSEAIDSLQRAAGANPLPEYQWILSDSLRATGRSREAGFVEAELKQKGASNDPRTFALFLATRGESVDTALQLAQRELEARGDIFTLDALAWSLAAAGRLSEARNLLNRALAVGTNDARLFFHASMIAARSGHNKEAHRWLARARSLQQMLLPSEQQLLTAQFARPNAKTQKSQWRKATNRHPQSRDRKGAARPYESHLRVNSDPSKVNQSFTPKEGVQ